MTLILEVPSEIEADLKREAEKRGVSLTDYALSRLGNTPDAGSESAKNVHPLIRLAESVRADIPKEEWYKLPADYAINYEHYLHGQPKAEE